MIIQDVSRHKIPLQDLQAGGAKRLLELQEAMASLEAETSSWRDITQVHL